MANDLISRNALLAEYDRVHIGEPGKARKLIADAPPPWMPWKLSMGGGSRTKLTQVGIPLN